MGTPTRPPPMAARSPLPAARKPTIAAISGPCFGGGVGLALACDFRVADASAYFAIPAARLSNVYGIVETRALFDAVGLAVAKEVLFTGRRYNADEALRIGLGDARRSRRCATRRRRSCQEHERLGAAYDQGRQGRARGHLAERDRCSASTPSRRSWTKRWRAPTTARASPPSPPSAIQSSRGSEQVLALYARRPAETPPSTM